MMSCFCQHRHSKRRSLSRRTSKDSDKEGNLIKRRSHRSEKANTRTGKNRVKVENREKKVTADTASNSDVIRSKEKHGQRVSQNPGRSRGIQLE